nr:aminoglycoside phosphotransferase family protein [Acinetobacter seifertii]
MPHLRNPCLLPFSRSGIALQLCFSGRAMIKTQVVKLTTSTAAIIADQMMSNASELRGLHGDLHHENIMFSSRGWLVIDPVGLVGEVGFGAANMFYDPADRDDLCLDPRRIAQMADAFSRALDVDPRRLLDQAYAYGCLSAAWNADGEEEQRDLAIAAAIKQVRQTSY